MNFKSLLCGLAAAAMFTACSNDEPNNGGGVTPGDGELVDAGYITVGINLPTVQGSRTENDNFDHGTPNEYAVKNAMLLVFTGAEANGEKAAKFHSAYDLTMTPGGVGPEDPNNITTTYLKTVHLSNVSDNDYLWGLVLVNYDGIVSNVVLSQLSQAGLKEHEQFKGLVQSMNLNGKALDANTNTTFESILGEFTSDSFINGGYFFMTNAVVSTADANGASDATVYTLQKIGNAKNVSKPTAAEAQAYPAASFYVERAVAKATLNAASVGTVEDLAANHIEIEKVEWVLDNQEPTSYIVRNVGDNGYIAYQQAGKAKRFVGTVKIGTTALQPEANLYRHYWAIDPTYAAGRHAEKNYTDEAHFKASGVDHPQYCHENTFPINFMDYKNTTRALLKVTFKLPAGNDGALYTVNNLQSDGNIFSTQGAATSLPVKAIVVSDQVRNAAKAALKDATYTITDNDLNITFAAPDANGVIKVEDVTFKENGAVFNSTPVIDPDAKAILINNVNASFQVVKYVGGVAYYDIRFKHFGDEYTPFLKGAAAGSIQNTTQAYGTEDNNYLGRWGMVRNNWYEINLNSIKKLGKPVLGQMDITNDDTPDDSQEIEKWLSFKINILSWAKRVQNEDL